MLASVLFIGSHSAVASIDVGDTAELFAIVWDPVAEASYSLDLGINVNDFRINAQQDSGSQQFWKLSASADPHLASLLALGTSISSLRWSVIAVDSTNDSFSSGDLRVFTTVQQGPAEGVINTNYDKLLGLSNNSFFNAVAPASNFPQALNEATDLANSSHSPNGRSDDYMINGSSFDVKGTRGYFGQLSAVGGGPQNFYGEGIEVSNAVGKSSWFYGFTDSSDDFNASIAVDEFDNIAHDGYWGLALNPADGSFALSYTLESATRTAAQREFALSIGRSEFNGGFAVRKLAYTDLDTTPQGAGDFTRRLTHDITRSSLLAPISAVPEPQTWGLMLAGLTGLAAIARRRRSA